MNRSKVVARRRGATGRTVEPNDQSRHAFGAILLQPDGRSDSGVVLAKLVASFAGSPVRGYARLAA